MRALSIGFKQRLVLGSSLFVFSLVFSPTAYAECYGYDSLGRLIKVDYDNAGTAQRTYSLDEHGNRTTVQDATSGGSACVEPDGNPSTGSPDPASPVQSGGSGSSPPPTNSPPVADDEIISLDTSASLLVNPLEGDTDDDGDTLTLASATSSSTVFTFTQSANSVTIVAGSAAGTGVIDYVVSDGNGGTDNGTINVTVVAPTVPPPPPPPPPGTCPGYPLLSPPDCPGGGGQPQ